MTSTVQPFHVWVFEDGTEWLRFFRVEEGYLLRFPDLAEFIVSRDGEIVRSQPLNGTPDNTVQHLYLNQVLPLAWSRQRKLVFHGSAVELGDAAVAFLGASGMGKSTLAAAFVAAGSRFLTDDGLRVELNHGRLLAYPSHPSIRLWADSMDALIGSDALLAPAVEYTSKARILADGSIRFCAEPRQLRRVFFLQDGDAEAVRITPIRPAEALVELAKHSFLLDIEERKLIAYHFDRLVEMVQPPIYCLLDYPRKFNRLEETRRAILAHLEADV